MKIAKLKLVGWISVIIGLITLGEYPSISLLANFIGFLSFFYAISYAIEEYQGNKDEPK
jgi:hypothetical protein